MQKLVILSRYDKCRYAEIDGGSEDVRGIVVGGKTRLVQRFKIVCFSVSFMAI